MSTTIIYHKSRFTEDAQIPVYSFWFHLKTPCYVITESGYSKQFSFCLQVVAEGYCSTKKVIIRFCDTILSLIVQDVDARGDQPTEWVLELDTRKVLWQSIVPDPDLRDDQQKCRLVLYFQVYSRKQLCVHHNAKLESTDQNRQKSKRHIDRDAT